jgi:methylase of polypeptide subunit release factors
VKIDETAITRIRRYLDEIRYSLVDFRLSFEAPVGPSGFPKFELLQKVIDRLDSSHRTLFRLLRLGESVTHAEVEQSLPPAILEAMVQGDLLLRTDAGDWRTPNLLLVPVEGVLVFVSIPAAYPTSSKAATIWFDLSSYVVAKALPGSLAGARVLDICSGSGIQSLLCATRGAASVTGLEISEDAVHVSQINALLNAAGVRTSFRHSDKLDALQVGEQFDFIICNTPYAPLIAGTQLPESVDEIGNSVLLSILDQIPERVSQNGQGLVASWRSISTNGTSPQRNRITSQLGEAGLAIGVFVDRAPDTTESVLRILQSDVEQRFGRDSAASLVADVRKLFQESQAIDGFYNELIFFKRGATEITEGSTVFGLAPPQIAETRA